MGFFGHRCRARKGVLPAADSGLAGGRGSRQPHSRAAEFLGRPAPSAAANGHPSDNADKAALLGRVLGENKTLQRKLVSTS